MNRILSNHRHSKYYAFIDYVIFLFYHSHLIEYSTSLVLNFFVVCQFQEANISKTTTTTQTQNVETTRRFIIIKYYY